MSSNNKIKKKLIKDVVTFLNNFICHDNVTTSYTAYGTRFISVDISVWRLKGGYIDEYITGVHRSISTENDFDVFKQEVLDKLSSLL